MKRAIFLSIICLLAPILFIRANSFVWTTYDTWPNFTKVELKGGDFVGWNNMTVGDFDGLSAQAGDKKSEIAVARGRGQKPEVIIYDGGGNELKRFLAFGEDFLGGVSLTSYDLDGDGTDEFVVGAGPGGTAHVRILDSDGKPKINLGFFAFDKSYSGGVSVAVGKVLNKNDINIIIGSGEWKNPVVRIFSLAGSLLKEIKIKDFPSSLGMKVSVIDLGGDGQGELAVSGTYGSKSWVALYRGDGTRFNNFKVFDNKFIGGVKLIATDLNKTKGEEMIVGSNPADKSKIAIVDGFNKNLKTAQELFTDDTLARGLNVGVGDINSDGIKEIMAMPNYVLADDKNIINKKILVNIKNQELQPIDRGVPLTTFQVSTGKWDMPTPLGDFKILNKSPRAFSQKYNLYMPWWMSFKPSYGIHELPEWAGGKKEGENHLGIRVSHGCIRLGVGPAEWLYDWTPVGTRVEVVDK